MPRKLAVTVTIATILVALATDPALAGSHSRPRAATSVTLVADASNVDFGDAVGLSGTVSPAYAGDSVDIRDGHDHTLGTTTTAADGSYSLDVAPDSNVTLHAISGGVDSPNVDVGVRAVVTARLADVRLFDTGHASGTVAPVRPSATVDLTLLHDGHAMATRTAALGTSGGYRAAFPIGKPGRYRVRASFSAPDLVTGDASSGSRATRLRRLHLGSTGRYVLLLERRLRELRYHLVDIDRRFDFRTADAVMAFRKVQRMRRIDTVTASVWRALAQPQRFLVHGSKHGFHIEVNQSRQVLATVRHGRVTAIIHVSTGAPSTPTRAGAFRVNRKIAGYSPHRLYYPSYFDGNRAIHGWPEVPPYNASHGCVRLPYWTARWIFHLAKLGTKVLIYH